MGRALDVSYAETDMIAKAIPFDLHMTIAKALDTNPELAKMYEENPKANKFSIWRRLLRVCLVMRLPMLPVWLFPKTHR